MSEFDAVIEAANRNLEKSGREAEAKKTPGEVMAEKRNRCYAMIDDACLGVFQNAEQLARYLAVQSRFEKYSLNNNLLIYAQRPDAVKLKEFDAWKRDEVSVKKGAKSLMILEPQTYTAADGTARRGYRAKHVFDIADVEAPESAYSKSTAYTPQKLMEALVHRSPVPIRRTEQDMGNDCALYDAKSGAVFYRAGMGFERLFPAIAEALARAEMDRGGEDARGGDHAFAAGCSAYVLARKYGVPLHDGETPAIPSRCASMEAEDAKRILADVHDTVKEMTERMSEVLDRSRDRVDPNRRRDAGEERA